ncbi:MAG: beta-lactamase family protein, partial [Anaerolineales bacterium]|nr:beta-lactamase family protein [Anaerolineales bacterium]
MNISTQFIKWLDRWVHNYMSVNNVPGLALAITDRNGLLQQVCYGCANLAAQTPVTADTVFEIGSISKSATAIAILQLCEEGKLDLHAPVERYLPWFQVPSAYSPITLHHLLSHTAGIINGPDFSDEPYTEVLFLSQTEASTPPGSFFHYSNVGYKALGLVLEAVLDQPYYETIRRRVLEPLGMENSTTTITNEIRLRMATGYDCVYNDRPFHPSYPLAPAVWIEYATADGSITATAADLAAYLRALMNYGKGVLAEASFQAMIHPVIQQEDDKPEVHYGYGLDIEFKDGRTTIGHSGGMIGYVADVRTDLEAGLGAVVLINGPFEPSDVTLAVLAALRAEANDEPLP